MADTAKDTKETKAQRTADNVILSTEEFTRRELARAQEEMRENPLDRAAAPGGVYRGADGSLHDAEGKPVKGKSASRGKSADDDEDDEGEDEDDLDGKTVEELAALAEERGVTVDGTGAGGRVLKSDYLKALS